MPIRSPAELAKSCQPAGHWIALPLQVYRINTLFMSTKGMQRAGVTKAPTTWAEFNDTAEKMKAAGMIPLANGGIRWDDGMKFEIALAGIDPDVYRRAIMQLDTDALKGKEVLAAFEQLRKLANWMNPNIAAQGWARESAGVRQGRHGHGADGRLGARQSADAPARPPPISAADPRRRRAVRPASTSTPTASSSGSRRAADLEAGQKLFAETRHAAVDAGDVLEDHRLDSGAHRRRILSGDGLYRRAAQLGAEFARRDRPGSRAAEPRAQHGAAERHDRGHDRCADRVRPQQRHPAAEGQKRLVAAVDERAVGACRADEQLPPQKRCGEGAAGAFGAAASAASLTELAIWVPLSIAAGHVVVFTAWTTWVSFTASTLMPDYAWVGLRNYWAVTRTANFQIAYVNLVIFGLGFVLLTMALGLLLAILLDQRVRGENVLRTIFLYPLAVSFVVTGTVWSWLLNPGLGLQRLVQDLGWTGFPVRLAGAVGQGHLHVDPRRRLAGRRLCHGAVPGRVAIGGCGPRSRPRRSTARDRGASIGACCCRRSGRFSSPCS